MALTLEKVSCTVSAQAGDDDKLYGTVTNQDIQKALEQESIIIDKRKIEISEPIKKLGVYTVKIKLHPEVEASLKVWVVKE